MEATSSTGIKKHHPDSREDPILLRKVTKLEIKCYKCQKVTEPRGNGMINPAGSPGLGEKSKLDLKFKSLACMVISAPGKSAKHYKRIWDMIITSDTENQVPGNISALLRSSDLLFAVTLWGVQLLNIISPFIEDN